MFDFGALPPEINSARMYAGPGSAPMLAAASAWDALAAQLESFGIGYSATLSTLQGANWSGEASTAMAAAAAPYVEWATATAAQAGQTAGQARAAAAAFEAAFAATVPPAVVAANRALLATLVATNFFGQNTPAIAATEAVYAEFWAQDAAAMYGYAATASAAAALTPFEQPPQTTNPSSQSGQGAAAAQAINTSAGQSHTAISQLMSAVPQQLQTLASGGSTNVSAADSSGVSTSTSVLTAFSDLDTLLGPLNLAYQMPYTVFQSGSFFNGLVQYGLQAIDLPKAAGSAGAHAAATGTWAPAGVNGPVLASVGRAAPVGGLSVPPNWTAAAPGAGPEAEPVISARPGFRALPTWVNATNAPAGMPTIGQAVNGQAGRSSNAVFRMRDRRYRMPRPALGG